MGCLGPTHFNSQVVSQHHAGEYPARFAIGHRFEQLGIPVRLSTRQISLIKKAVTEVFGPSAMVWLFGSRTDDSAKGGDIDLYIEAEPTDNLTILKSRLLVKLWGMIGAQKIDIIVKQPQQALKGIHKEATERGIRL